METALNFNQSISPYKNYWLLSASADPFENDRNDFLKNILPNNILSFMEPFATRLYYPKKLNDIDTSSVKPEDRITSETFLVYHIDNETLGDDSYENSILEAMVESDTDVIMPPKKEYKISLKFTVEKNKGPYFVD